MRVNAINVVDCQQKRFSNSKKVNHLKTEGDVFTSEAKPVSFKGWRAAAGSVMGSGLGLLIGIASGGLLAPILGACIGSAAGGLLCSDDDNDGNSRKDDNYYDDGFSSTTIV